MNTPYGHDVLAQLADACHRRHIPLCLYFSCIDWHHPNYPNQGRSHELPEPLPGDEPDLEKYMDFVKAQVRELCTSYGEIHGFWWDGNIIKHLDPSLNAMIRQLQSKAVINDRGYDEGDFGTPERDFETNTEAGELTHPTEAYQSVGTQSWGYRTNEDYYTVRYLISSIDGYLARGANYLLNVGPTADGVIPSQAEQILSCIGNWFGAARESLLDVTPAPHFTTNPNVLVTQRDNTIYIHLVREPILDAVQLKPINVMPLRATLLNTGEPVEFTVEMLPNAHASQEPYLHLRRLPVDKLSDTVLIIKLEFDESF